MSFSIRLTPDERNLGYSSEKPRYFNTEMKASVLEMFYRNQATGVRKMILVAFFMNFFGFDVIFSVP